MTGNEWIMVFMIAILVAWTLHLEVIIRAAHMRINTLTEHVLGIAKDVAGMDVLNNNNVTLLEKMSNTQKDVSATLKQLVESGHLKEDS